MCKKVSTISNDNDTNNPIDGENNKRYILFNIHWVNLELKMFTF